MATHSSIVAWRILIDRGAWPATVHGVTKSWKRLKRLSTHELGEVRVHRGAHVAGGLWEPGTGLRNVRPRVPYGAGWRPQVLFQGKPGLLRSSSLPRGVLECDCT